MPVLLRSGRIDLMFQGENRDLREPLLKSRSLCPSKYAIRDRFDTSMR